MFTLIQGGLETLSAVINDLQSGINSRHGYKAWFKGNASSAYVQEMLQNIYTAQPKIGLQPLPHLQTGPRFLCVAPQTISHYPWMDIDPFDYCASHYPGLDSFYYPGSSYIVICPVFWSVEPWPSRSFCPTVIHNRFVGNGALLSGYKTYILIHEMVHFYLGMNSLAMDTAPPEQYELNACVTLDKLNSIRNPANYQHYIASKS